MSPDRRPLELAFSEPAADQVLPAAEQTCPLPAGSSPFLEPDLIVPGPSTAPALARPTGLTPGPAARNAAISAYRARRPNSP